MAPPVHMFGREERKIYWDTSMPVRTWEGIKILPAPGPHPQRCTRALPASPGTLLWAHADPPLPKIYAGARPASKLQLSLLIAKAYIKFWLRKTKKMENCVDVSNSGGPLLTLIHICLVHCEDITKHTI